VSHPNVSRAFPEKMCAEDRSSAAIGPMALSACPAVIEVAVVPVSSAIASARSRKLNRWGPAAL
jgi:hypothetical protein